MSENLHNPNAVNNWHGKAMLFGLRRALLGNRSDEEIFAELEALHVFTEETIQLECTEELSLKTPPHPFEILAKKVTYKKTVRKTTLRTMLKVVQK